MAQKIQGGVPPGTGRIEPPKPPSVDSPAEPSTPATSSPGARDTFERAAGKPPLAGLLAGGATGPATAAPAAAAFDPAALPAPLREAFDAGFARGASRHLASDLAAALGRPEQTPLLREAATALVAALPGALREGLENGGVPTGEAAKAAASALPAVQSQLVAAVLPAPHQALLAAIGEGPAAFVAAAATALGSRGGEVLQRVASDPAAFVGDLLGAVGTGAAGFATNLGTHLRDGIVGWTSRSLEAAGIAMPAGFDVASLAGVAGQVLATTGERLLDKAEGVAGKEAAGAIRSGWEALATLAGEGPAGLWEGLKGRLAEGSDRVAGAGQGLAEVVGRAVTRLAGLLNPTGAIVQATLAIYNVASFGLEKAGDVAGRAGDVAMAVGDFAGRTTGQVGDFAGRTAGKVGAAVEGAAARTGPVVLGFLADVVGLGDLGDRVGGVVANVRDRVATAVDKAVSLGGDAAAGMMRYLGGQEAKILGQLATTASPSPGLPDALADLLAQQTRLAAAGEGALAAFADAKTALAEALATADPRTALEALGGRAAADAGIPSREDLQALLAAQQEGVGRLLAARNEAVTTVLAMMALQAEAMGKLFD